ncbi:MAG TPA: methyltransferase domain-containing protein, partial [Microvirga sp.]|nr:methyltransferase domain-containing protein [Microvirga sp.]
MRARLGIADGGCADRVLEIGAGSGQATGDLARMARSLTCIEPGPTFVALLRERFTGLARFSLHQGDYEGFTDSAPFDLVV